MRPVARRGAAIAVLGTLLTLATVAPALADGPGASSEGGLITQLLGVVTNLVHALLGGL